MKARVQQRGGGGCVVRGPDGGSAVATGAHDPTLLKAMVRAEDWRKSLLSGSAVTIEALAQANGMKRGYTAACST